MYIYWNLFIHYGHVSTSVLLMVIHTCVIFFLMQAPLGVGPGVPCRHLVGSGKNMRCTDLKASSLQNNCGLWMVWVEYVKFDGKLNYGNHDSWSEKNLTNEKWENTQGNDATIPSPQILIENPDTNHSWRCSTPATATCCCQWTFTNRYDEIISMYANTNYRYTISFLNLPNSISNTVSTDT